MDHNHNIHMLNTNEPFPSSKKITKSKIFDGSSDCTHNKRCVFVSLLHVPVCCDELTHRGRVTHICANKLTIIGTDDGLPISRHQAIIWTDSGILLIRTLKYNSMKS